MVLKPEPIEKRYEAGAHKQQGANYPQDPADHPRRRLVAVIGCPGMPKTADGATRAVTLPRAAERRLCPARVLEDWLRSSETRFGPVFRKIDRWGNLEHQRLGTDALRRILARRSLRRLRVKKAAA